MGENSCLSESESNSARAERSSCSIGIQSPTTARSRAPSSKRRRLRSMRFSMSRASGRSTSTRSGGTGKATNSNLQPGRSSNARASSSTPLLCCGPLPALTSTITVSSGPAAIRSGLGFSLPGAFAVLADTAGRCRSFRWLWLGRLPDDTCGTLCRVSNTL